MIGLLEAQQLLIAGMNADPLLCLANAVVWLDPFWDEFADEDGCDEGDDNLSLALRVVRDSFPDIYVQVIEQLRTGSPWPEIERLVCGEIEKIGIPLESLEWMGYGIPLPAYGVTLEEPEFYESHPDLVPVLEEFGIDPVTNPYCVEVPEYAQAAGQYIAEDLEDHPDEGYRQLSWLMQWLFSCSGNSVVLCGIEPPLSSDSHAHQTIIVPDHAYQAAQLLADDLEEHIDVRYRQMAWLLRWLFSCTNNPCLDWDDETMCSVEPLSWSPDDVAFAVEIIAEADTLMADIQSALHWLQNTPVVLAGLALNVVQLYQALEKRPQQPPRLTFHWPDPDHDTLDEVLHRIGISDGEIRDSARSSAVPN